MVLQAFKLRAGIAVFVFILPAVFFLSVAWDRHSFFYLPALFCFGMACFYVLPFLFPKTETQLNDIGITVGKLNIPLDRIDYFYEDSGCITVVSKDKIGGLIFRNYIRVIHRELFIYKGMAGEAKEISSYLAANNVRKKAFLWRRFAYYLAF